jgi:hypothetical protein
MRALNSGQPSRRIAWSTAAKLLGTCLLILGGKFLVLRMCSSPLPVFDQWQAEGQYLLRPWLRGELHLGDLFAPWAQHRIVWTRLLALGLFQLNGQWDTQVEAIAAEVLHAGTAGLLGVILIRRLGRAAEDAILVSLVLLFGLPFAHEDTLSGGFASQYYTLLLFAVVAIWGLASHRPGSAGWWVGAAAAILAWFSVATGGLPALAVAAWMGLRLARREGSPRDNWTTLGVALAVGAGGLCLSIGVGQRGALAPHSVIDLLIRFAGLLGWPNPTAWAAPVAYAPFACLAWRALRGRRDTANRVEAFLIPLGIFVLSNTAALAYARNRYGGLAVSRYMDFLAFGSVVNFACLLLLLREAKDEGSPPGTRSRLGLLTAGWVAAAGFGLSQMTTANIADDLPFVKSCSAREVENVAAFVARPDLPAFSRKDPNEIMCEQPRMAGELLEDPNILAILPWQVRRPVVLEAAAGSPQVHRVIADANDPSNAGWLLEPGHDGRPVYFRSRTIASPHLPYLRFPAVSGLGDDAFLALVDDRSDKITWLRENARGSGWHSATVRTPAGPFHVEAVVAAGSNRRLAFSYPREVGWLSAWVDPILDSAVGFLFAGCGIWLGAIFWRRLDPPAADRHWQRAPLKETEYPDGLAETARRLSVQAGKLHLRLWSTVGNLRLGFRL